MADNKSRKHGRNRHDCMKYRAGGNRELNKARKLLRHILRIEKKDERDNRNGFEFTACDPCAVSAFEALPLMTRRRAAKFFANPDRYAMVRKLLGYA